MAKEKKVEQITDMEVDFAQWYTDVCRKAELVEYASVKGFTILRPYGYAIWENMQRIMDGEFKKTGHENVAMPVLIPCPEAGCSLAESCDAGEFAAFKAAHPGHTVVSYVNTTVGVKALTDICCTSSNALKVVESIPADQPVIFAPDRNLGSYIQKLTGRRNMVLWDGACHVHEEFSLEKLLTLKREHPAAKVVVHPECRAYIVEVADYVGSTAGILEYCGRSDAQEFIVVTEAGILAEMKRRYPEKEFIPAPPDDETCGCNNCKYMKMVTLENICACLENESPEIVLDDEVRRAAERSILNMINVK